MARLSNEILLAQEDADVIELGSIPKAPNDKNDNVDPFLVAFNRPYDEGNPFDWRTGKKWMVTDVLSATGFNRIMVSTIMAPALTTIASELSMSSTEAAMSMSIYLLATAFGPLLIGPLSEVWGRQVILHGSNIWFLMFNLLCGFAKTKETLIAARFLAGFGASAIYALAGGVLGDIWRPEQRGRSLSVYLLIPLLAAAVGPILGGFIAVRTSWRWMFWSSSIFQAVMIVASFFSFPETYGPVILRRRAEKLRKETGNSQYYIALDRSNGNKAVRTKIVRAISRPVRLLLFHPVIQISTILSGFEYGILYFVLSTFSELFVNQYQESVEISGLHYIACSLGEIMASQLGGLLLDYLYKKQKSLGEHDPEDRIPLAFPGLIIGWLGALMYGWVAQYRVHWILVDIGVFIMLFGLQLNGMPMTAYIIDTYPEHTSSAMAALQFGKSLCAFLFPLCAPILYSRLDYGRGNSVIALVGVLLTIPLSTIIWKRGARFRQRSSTIY